MAFKSREEHLAYHRRYDRERTARSFAQQLKRAIGRCERCGYDRHLGSLSWHHVFPEFKSGKDLRKLSLAKAAKELYFCLLICENCHREGHAGLWDPIALRGCVT